MIIQALRPKSGIRFAWLPVMTPEGKVWLEHVRYEWQEHGFGGYSYRRMIPESRYAAGERAYSTPANPTLCHYYNPDGPTPCRHPHCNC